jgi:octaprenyl-diphosphate synthase
MLAADSKVVSPISAGNLRTQPAQSWRHIIDPVEPFLEVVSHRLVQQVKAFDPEIVPYAEYALKGQGKHLRPALVALTAQALGPASEAHVTVAVIVEMVHLATLVHDDIMDEAEIRRGRLTLAANWGNDLAVLFGDCCHGHQYRLLRRNPADTAQKGFRVQPRAVLQGAGNEDRRAVRVIL